MQAASQALELNRLYSLMGIGIESVSMIAYLIIIISAFSIFISLFNSMKERQYELALMRVMGGSKMKLFAIIETEGILIAVTGYLVGMFFSRMGILFISSYTENTFHYSVNNLFALKDDMMLFFVSVIVGFLASFLPALKAMNTDISRTLAK
jgi:putative ABC transport system permease protein